MSNIFKTAENKTAVKNSTGRVLFALIAILVEANWLIFSFSRFNEAVPWVETVTRLIAFFLVLWIYNQNKTSSMKMPWIILILIAPVLGVFLFYMVGFSGTTGKMRRRFERIDKQLMVKLKEDPKAQAELARKDPTIANISRYLENNGFPLYRNSGITYYDDASKALEAQKEALRSAENFIFMEYHAIEDAESWAGICEILEEKASAGVTVRIFYDDAGSTGFINGSFIKKMESKGIACRVFNPIGPVLNFFLNNRDHRKITVVDGRIGFTGGYNLANEYFNLTHPYGYWKDSGVRIEGQAVQTLTVLFLEMWNAIRSNDVDDEDFDLFLPEVSITRRGAFIQPYGDTPMDDVQVGEDVYMHIINSACRYIYFTTPYLIITDEMTRALTLAASRGVDVRILTPGIPDKKVVYNVTRSYYAALVNAGVRIYEYTPGFLHAKMCVSDDRIATCGTINLDYRSLYHHFENGCLFAYCDAVLKVRADIQKVMLVSEDVTELYKPRLRRRQIREERRLAMEGVMPPGELTFAERYAEWRELELRRKQTGQSTQMLVFRSILRLFSELL